MPDRIALSFLALEEKLMGAQQTLNPPTLNFADYSSMALDCNISENNILTATKFLNDLGSLVYFSDKDEGLNDLVVVDPQWITKTFATVVSLKFGFIRDGIMKVSDLPHIWAPPNYPQAFFIYFVLSVLFCAYLFIIRNCIRNWLPCWRSWESYPD